MNPSEPKYIGVQQCNLCSLRQCLRVEEKIWVELAVCKARGA